LTRSSVIVNDEAAPAAQKDQWQRRPIDQIAFRRLFDAVPRRDMGDLMGDHARQLSFVVGGFDQTAIDVKKTAGQCERIDVRRINHLDRHRYFDIGVDDYVLRDAVDNLEDDRVVKEFRVPTRFSGHPPADRDLFLQRIEIELAFVDVALADQLRILLLLERLLSAIAQRGREGERNDQQQ
jgi:hypothetical protein